MGMFLLPWGAGSRNEKATDEKANIPVTMKTSLPVTQLPALNRMKRKRRDSGSPISPWQNHDSGKIHVDQISHEELSPSPVTNSSTTGPLQRNSNQTSVMLADTGGAMDWEGTQKGRVCMDDSTPLGEPSQLVAQEVGEDENGPARSDPTSLAILRETVEYEFNLEILLKHDELRLIDHEIAKCQAALEQLRRCHIIPYPAVTSNVDDMQIVGSGSGPKFDTKAMHPPPWGVADGPYARHYEKWLIPDSAFDGNSVEVMAPPRPAGQGANKALPERITRGSISAENGALSSTSRSQRGISSARLQVLPHGYPEHKEDKGPMILKRSTDGHMVKLICTDCRRENFNSAQGFINHCRIAHNRGYASHDAAAIACGEEVDINIGESCFTTSASAGLVHPLIRSVRSTPHVPLLPFPRQEDSSIQTPRMKSIQAPLTRYSFTPSSQTPHLSAHFARIGLGGDLEEMVNDAKTRVNVDTDVYISSDEEDQDQDEVMQDAFDGPADATHSRSTRGVIREGGRLPFRATMSPAPLEHPPSSKGVRGARKPDNIAHIFDRALYTSPYSASASEPSANAARPLRDGDSSHLIDTENTSPVLNLSPNTPIESHPAPSLVSDDGDLENTHSESESPSSAEDEEGEEDYLDIEVEDHDAAAAAAALGLAAGSVKPRASPTPGPRSSALRAPAPSHPGPGANRRRVSFASPIRRSREFKDHQKGWREKKGK